LPLFCLITPKLTVLQNIVRRYSAAIKTSPQQLVNSPCGFCQVRLSIFRVIFQNAARAIVVFLPSKRPCLTPDLFSANAISRPFSGTVLWLRRNEHHHVRLFLRFSFNVT